MTYIDIITWAYSCVGIVSLTAYLPQIIKLIREPDSAHKIALSSWLIWTLTGGISVCYAAGVAHDPYITWVAGVGFAGTVAVTGLTLYVRLKAKLPSLGGEVQTYP